MTEDGVPSVCLRVSDSVPGSEKEHMKDENGTKDRRLTKESGTGPETGVS